MICDGCQHQNSPDAAFCIECGAELPVQCAGCGTTLPTRANFCPRCGHPRAAEAGPAAGPSDRDAEVDGERRLLTVMFCDLVDSTELSQRLDPEELRSVVAAYQKACVQVIDRFGGQVAQYLGDGLLVYFGHPQAHEDDPVRAVDAALGILEKVPQLNVELAAQTPVVKDDPLKIRIAVHTGPVVVAPMGYGERREELALGETLNVASRLQEVASAQTAVVSATTHELVAHAFEFEDLGTQTLRGLREPLAVWKVQAARGGRRYGLRSAAGRLTPFVGRRQELALLLDRWEQVKEGRGQAILVSADAGMGKSRLVRVLQDHLADESHQWLETGCLAHHENSAFHAVIELLEAGLAISPDEPAEERLAKLETSVRGSGLPPDEALPVLAKLLSLATDTPSPPLEQGQRVIDVERLLESDRRKTLELLAGWVLARAERQPLVLVVEDLHWSDPSTRDFLRVLLDEIAEAPLFLVLTSRPGFEAAWLERSELARLTVHPLTRKQMETMIEGIAEGQALRPGLVEQVAGRTDGVPLFVEEMTKALLESETVGTDGTPAERKERGIPATLQSSLMARLDRLGSAKEVAQLAAVLGRHFSHDLIDAVSPLDAVALDDALDRLVEAELLYRRGVAPHASYVFKHVLIQDTAYQSLLKSARRQHHERIAEALEEHFSEQVGSEPEVVARHFEEAGLQERAIPHLQRAGERAIERAANTEAIGHLNRAAELLKERPASPDRDRQELALQVALAAPLIAAKGFASVEVEHVYVRARALCDRVGDKPQLFRVLYGLSALYESRGEFDKALDFGDQLLTLAERADDTSLLIQARLALGMADYWKGDRVRALEQFERGIELYEPSEHRKLAYTFGLDPGVGTRSFAAQSAWYLGHHDRAERFSREAVELGREGGQPYSLAYAIGFAGMLHFFRREPESAMACAEEAMAVAEEQHFPLIQGVGRLVRAWALAALDRGEETVEQMDRSRAEFRSTGLGVGAPMTLGSTAEILLRMGRLDPASRALERALVFAERQHQRYWDPELYRLQAEVLLAGHRGAEDEAEVLLRRAIASARAQSARSLELRAAMSLARVLAPLHRRDEGRELLAQCYGGFTEGLDAPELSAACALLDELY